MIEVIGGGFLGLLLLTLAYFGFLERTYLRDQAREIGDHSIVSWRRGFSALVAALAIIGVALLAWTTSELLSAML